MKEKKKPNIVSYTLLMAFIFIFIVDGIIWGAGGNILVDAIENYSKGSLVIREAVLAFLVFIVLLLFKNSYVFTQKREKVTVGLFYGLFYIIGSVIFILIGGILEGGLRTDLSVINVALGCFLVGICEEFLCRGWLLNEFLERYGDTKKGIWYSIIISGLIFGLMHFGNIASGQNVVSTITQVINACGIGIVLGVIYYKTKNIWSVVIIHGLWDFSLFLAEIAPVKEKVEVVTGFSIISILFSILLIMAELLTIIPYLKDIDAKPRKKSVITFSILGIVLYLIFMIVTVFVSSSFGETYKYDNLTLKNYAVTRDNYEKYTMKYNDYIFELTEDKGNLKLTNINTNSSITIECESLYDYIIMEDNDYFTLAYIDYTDSANAFLKYIFINKQNLSNEDSFLDAINNNIKKYLISSRAELVVISDYENNKSYISAFDVDYGHYVLIDNNKMAILNRDKK